jgi:hypothetical protein
MKRFKDYLNESKQLDDAWEEYQTQKGAGHLPKNITRRQLKKAFNMGSDLEDDLKDVGNTDASDPSLTPKRALELFLKYKPGATPKDFKRLKQEVLAGKSRPSIVADVGGKRHLLTGNTRAMIAVAHGMKPKIRQIRLG